MELILGIIQKLSELSATHHADDTDTKPQEELLEHVKHWEKGSNTDPATSPSPSQGEGGGGDQTKGGQPIVAISGQAGIAISTPQSMTLATGTNLDLAAVQDTSITTGRSIKARAAELISLFAHKAGMKIIAASGKIDIQAQADNIEMTAAKLVNLTALEDIELRAPKITLITDGAGTDWGGGKITHKMQGTNTIHTAYYHPTGPASPSLSLPGMPQSELKTDEKFVLYDAQTGDPIPNRSYRIETHDKQVIEGVSDAEGRTDLSQSQSIGLVDIAVFPDDSAPA